MNKKISINNLIISAKELLEGSEQQINADVVEALSTQSIASSLLAIATMQYDDKYGEKE